MIIADLLLFLGLLIVSLLVRYAYERRDYSDTGAGGIVMSVGIFAAYAYTQLPGYTPLCAKLLTIEIFILWLLTAWSYLGSLLHGTFRKLHYEPFLQRFTIGTWVAGTAVLAALTASTLPEISWLSRVLAIAAIVIYLPYLVVFVHGYIELWKRPFKQAATGIILLATVSTQSIIIALHDVFGSRFSSDMGPIIIPIDILFLCSGLALIALHYRNLAERDIATDWKNANCIIHGAVSITGLAAVLSASFSGGFMVGLWYMAAFLFVAVESIEVLRAYQRVRRHGLIRGLLTYDVSQWTRTFTFGMFYAFTFALRDHAAGDVWRPLLDAIVAWGQYAVLILLVIEIVLFIGHRKPNLRALTA